MRGLESDAMLRQMTLDDYKMVLYRQGDGAWVAEVPAISGCYALMPTLSGGLVGVGRRLRIDRRGIPGEGPAAPRRYD